ncbi:MAG TPA: hypothetical protein VGS22_17860 [Thermoanaerobaculia bacterium]|jgi:hypothetical protein|nr:hypothetical protein [Thermoanaerobaculia bacterium]
MDLRTYYNPFATLLGEALGTIVMICFVAVPLGWIFAGIATWRPLPHFFAVLSRLLVGVYAVISALLLVFLAISWISGVSGTMLGFIAASVSGILAWTIVGMRSRAEESIPSLL